MTKLERMHYQILQNKLKIERLKVKCLRLKYKIAASRYDEELTKQIQKDKIRALLAQQREEIRTTCF